MTLVMLFLLAVTGFAVPAKPGLKRLLTLTDGATVNAILVGDEFGHFWKGADGKAYQLEAGTDTYQEVNAQTVTKRAQQKRAKANQRRTKRLAPRKIGTVGSITGDKKGIIILVNFAKKSFTATQSDFNKLANQVNYNSGNYKGSMYDYFYAQSEGQFRLTFDVVGPYEVSGTYQYYGANDDDGNDKHPAEMVIEALKKADADVNFADYDWDGDGEVEQVYVVYAGKGEADGGSEDTIWPHEYDLYSANYYGDGDGPQTLDGVTINTYACGGEQNGTTGETAGIGTMCHEFSHCLGYPDFYDTDYSGGQGMFEWDLMDSGSYNDDGYQPAGYTSYERWVAGWKTPITLEYTQTISNMAALQNGGDSYIIYNKGNNNEYYLLENRQKTGWDASLPGEGLLILHVDYDATVWNNNQPNDDTSHQRMTWIPADNEYQYTTYQGTKYYTEAGAANDPFPYGNVNAFGKTTTPAAKLYNKNSDNTYYLDSSVENITQNSDGTVSFNFVGISNVATPTFSPAAGRYTDAQRISISCETTGATIYYTLDGTVPTTSSTVYSTPLTINETTIVKALAVKDGEQSAVAMAKYTIGASTSNPNTTTFKLVTSTDDLEPGMRYIIACGSKSMAAGALNGTYLGNVQVNVSSDVITITDNVAVFVLEETSNGWTFQNESTNEYLVSTDAKKVSYSSTAGDWTLSNGTTGVVMVYGSYGTMLYNVSSPRFTTYTSSPTSSMILANLYIEDSSSTPVTPDPLIVADETLTFSTTVGTPQTLTFDVLSEGLTEDITVTLSGTNSNLFSLGSSTISRTASELGTTGSVTFTPTTAGTFTATLTLTSAGAAAVTVTLTATATDAYSGDPTGSCNEFTLITSASDFEEGDYIIVYDNGAMNTTVSSNRLQYTAVTPNNNVITTDDATIIWHIAPSGNYYTIYNAEADKYAASNGTKNQAQLLANGTDDKSLWSVTTGTTFEFTNKANAASSVNATLRRNGTYGFACYSTSTGGKLSLYKRSSGGTSTAYYQPADGKTGEALKTAMCGIIYNHTEKDYDYLWTAYQTTDVRSDGKIWDMYSNITNYDPVNGSHTSSAEGSGFNREHSFPKSWFGGDIAPMYTDLHHVYPTDGYVNNRRNNYPFGETNGETYKSNDDFSKVGTCTYPGYTGKVFEPDDEYKGDFARTYFYMVTCYEEKLPDWYTNYSSTEVTAVLDGNTYPGLSDWQLNMLMKWAKNDPVSEKEIARNNAVYGIQKNRNPFIDYPGLQEYIWGFMKDETFSYDNYVEPVYKQDVTMTFSPVTATATLGETFTEPTLTTTPANLTVSYSSSAPSVATVDAGTGEVTLIAAGTTTITAAFAGNDTYNAATASYTLTVSAAATPTTEEPLLYEGVSTYSSANDGTSEMASSNKNYDYTGWTSLSKIFAGGTNNAYSNGGCLKFGSGSAAGSMTSGNITLTGGGTLTFYLKKYGSDTGKLNVAVTGATVDVTQFTPQSDWTLCTVNLTDATGTVTITLATSSKRAYVDEIMLTANKLTISDAGSNSTAIAAASDKQYDVTLAGRTLYKDGNWNTICLPFDVTLADSPLAGATAKTLTAASMSGTHVEMTFGDAVTTLQAGVPYIIKWDASSANIENPVFSGVTIKNKTAADRTITMANGNVKFIGYYDAFSINTPANDDIYYMTTDNTLKHTAKQRTLKACRAYFQFTEAAAARQFVLNFGENDVTAVEAIMGSDDGAAWYSLEGVRLGKQPTKKGLYIQNGRKVIVK